MNNERDIIIEWAAHLSARSRNILVKLVNDGLISSLGDLNKLPQLYRVYGLGKKTQEEIMMSYQQSLFLAKKLCEKSGVGYMLTEDNIRQIIKEELSKFFMSKFQSLGLNGKPIVDESVDDDCESMALVDSKSIQEILGISEPTLIRAKQRGDIPYVVISGTHRYNVKKVVESLEKKQSKKKQK